MHLLIFITFLLNTLTGYAECLEGSLEFWPITATIRQNPVIVVDGNGPLGKCITSGIGSAYRALLQSGNEKINLIVLETLTGHHNRMQVVLKPQKSLTAGQEYELVIEAISPSDTTRKNCNQWLQYTKKAKWLVLSGMDTEAPQWIGTPVFKDEYFNIMGCGNAVHANFRFTAFDSSAYLIRASVTSLETGNVTICLLRPENNIIKLGHGMCWGPFAFSEGKDYKVTFGLMDASGNQFTQTACAIPLTRPKVRFNITGDKQ